MELLLNRDGLGVVNRKSCMCSIVGCELKACSLEASLFEEVVSVFVACGSFGNGSWRFQLNSNNLGFLDHASGFDQLHLC